MADNAEPPDQEPKDEGYDPSLAYRILEEDFQQVIEELNRHDRLGHFSIEFERVMDALRESHAKEKELVERNKALNAQIAANASKLAAALKLSQADQDTIEKLKQEVDTAWRMIDVAHTKEQLAQESLENLRAEVSRLTQELEATKKLGADQDQEAGAISKNKEALVREKERLTSELVAMKERLANAIKYQEELERRNELAETKIAELTVEAESQKSEVSKEKRFKEKLEEELKDLKNEIILKDTEIQTQASHAVQNSKTISKLEQHLREQKVANEKLNKEIQDLSNSLRLSKIDYEQQSAEMDKLQQDFQARSQELKSRDEELMKLRTETNRVQKSKEALERKISALESLRTAGEEEKNKLSAKISLLEKDISNVKRQAAIDKKEMDSLKREKEMLTKAAQKATAYGQEQQKLIMLQELHKKKLQEELEEHTEQVNRQKQELLTLQNEKDRLVSESVDLTNQVQDYVEDLKLKQMELYDYKKRLADADGKIKIQMGMFEQVRTEKNQISKSLVEAQDEINELKHKLKVKSYQVEQLKEDISTKENLILKEQFALQKVLKEKEGIRLELQKGINELRELKEKNTVLMQEETRLQKIISEADKDRTRLNKELNQVANERDILGTQLVRRNDELSLLYEKVKILQCTLHKGEAQYDQRLEDIRLLKIEIKKLRQEKAMLARSMNNLADLRQEIFHLERDFTRERLKCRALEEELQNPLNVHRWRKLEGSDPTTFELIQKIQILQRRLLTSNEEAIKRESQLKETERLYVNLRQLLARQPGPETLEKLKKTQIALKDRGVKMKCLIAELTVYENQITEYKLEINHVNKEMNELKKKYFEMKRREQKVKQKERDLAHEENLLPVLEPITGNTSKTRFIGGGFNVTGSLARVAPVPMNAC